MWLVAGVHAVLWVLQMLVFAHVVIFYIRAFTRARWVYSPLVRSIDEAGAKIVRPFRELLRRTGIDTGSLDFSPVMALVSLMVMKRLLLMLMGGI